VPIAGFILFKQKASLFVWIAIPISVIGLYFLSIQDGFTIKAGDLFVIACAFCYAAQIVLIDRVSNKISAIRFSSIQFFVTGVVCFILSLIFGNATWEGVIDTIVPILYCGILSSGAAFTLQTVGQKHTAPAVASLLFATEGLFATIFECIFDKKLPAPRIAIGCVFMMVAIVLSQITFSPKKKL
jgi:drug/metabolite transporter (DMT)-like permease